MKTDAKNYRSIQFAIPAGFNVDRAGGEEAEILEDAAGREAKGHGIYIDAETVKTGHECAQARGQLKGAIRHPSWDEYFSKGADRVLDFPGWFAGFSVKGAELVAEKFEFYESFRTSDAASFDRIMEMADKTPNLFGLSIEAWGYAVFVAEDGKEYGTKPDGVKLKYEGVPALRITDLFFAAFVDEPAATDGLFARFSSLLGGKRKGSAAARLEFETFAETWAEKHALGRSEGPVGAPSVEPALPSEKNTMKIIADLKAKYGTPEHAARFSAAMVLVGNTPSDQLAALNLSTVDAQLDAAELSALRSEVTRLKADLAARDTTIAARDATIATLTTERNDWQKKYDQLRTTGHVPPVDLGTGTGGTSADEANPWVKGEHFSRDRQAELTRKDPVRAAALKEAAKTINAGLKPAAAAK